LIQKWGEVSAAATARDYESDERSGERYAEEQVRALVRLQEWGDLFHVLL
jgi:hypothetical protein